MIASKISFAMALGAAALASVACGGPSMPARAPEVARASIASATAVAFQADAVGGPDDAIRAWFKVIDEARYGRDVWQFAGARAAVDALVTRDVSSLSEVTGRTALAFRTPRANPKDSAEEEVYAKLVEAWRDSPTPVRAIFAQGMLEIAERRGDAAAAAKARAARGCASEVTLLGPVDWTSVSALGRASALDAFDAPLPASTTNPGPFGRTVPATVISERGCNIDLLAVTGETGARDVVVDAIVPSAQTVYVEVRSAAAARVRIGGKPLLERAHDLGSNRTTRDGFAEVESGRVRIVARVAGDDHGPNFGLSVLDENGEPLKLVAPKPGERATAKATRTWVPADSARAPSAPELSTRNHGAETLTLGLGALAADDPRTAERTLASFARNPNPPPDVALAYVRALDGATDLSAVERADRARTAIGKVLATWPKAWEANLFAATLAAERRGQGEAAIQALRELDIQRSKGAGSPMLDAFEATWSARTELQDRADAALARFQKAVPNTTFTAELAQYVTKTTLAERARTRCTASIPLLDRSGLDCYTYQYQLGARPEARRELERLRALAGAPRSFGPMASRDAVAAGDLEWANAEEAKLLPGERSINASYTLAPKGDDIRRRLAAQLTVTREPPQLLGALLTAAGEDRLRPFEGVAEKLVAQDRAHPTMPDAATVVLSRTEKYVVDPSGLVYVLLHDIRRVGGTTDVEENAQAGAPLLLGRSSLHAALRRILKADGRILLPDRTPGAAQSHADLSQLGPGDAVEVLYEGFALPNEMFEVGFETPDLLPDRTAVANATVEVRLPKDLKVSLRAHPLLGKGETRDEGSTRVTTWTLKDKPARRFEDGVPKMDRSVSVTATTLTWATIARGLGETLRALDERDPEVSEWARHAATAKSKHAAAENIVLAVGEALRQPGGAMLADFGVGRGGARQSRNARSFITEREGCRTWVIARALRELGIPYEVVVAEQEPYSADPDYPAFFGRFVHPLIVAQIPSTDDDKSAPVPMWIDADVQGPPLPLGRFSPELRGRKVLHADGSITALPAAEGAERDEIDVRLALDEKGDAKGSFTAVLRGRAAQELADAFTRIVGDERQRALRNIVLGYLPTANVDLVVLSSSEGSWQIALRADVSISGYAQPEKKKSGATTWVLPGVDPIHYVYPRPFVTTVTSSYASHGARQNALAVERAVQYHLRRKVELPAGAKITRAPGPLRQEASLLNAERTSSGSAKAVEDDFVLSIRTGTIPRDGYAAFVDAARRIDESFLTSTRITPPETK